MIGREMSVPLRHGQARVTEYFLERLEIPTAHHEPPSKMVPRVVEAEVFQFGVDHGVLECGPDAAGLEHLTLTRAGQARQGVVHHLAHGNLTPLARLRLLQPPRLRSTRSQVRPSSSPFRRPVSRAMVTILVSSGFLDWAHAASSRISSSGSSQRIRPWGSFSRRILGTADRTPHSS